MTRILSQAQLMASEAVRDALWLVASAAQFTRDCQVQHAYLCPHSVPCAHILDEMLDRLKTAKDTAPAPPAHRCCAHAAGLRERLALLDQFRCSKPPFGGDGPCHCTVSLVMDIAQGNAEAHAECPDGSETRGTVPCPVKVGLAALAAAPPDGRAGEGSQQ